MKIRSILLPTDFSDCATYALSFAASFAREHGAPIICLHVIEPLMPAVGYTGIAETAPLSDLTEQLEAAAERELPRLAGAEEVAGIEVREIIARGDAAAEIVRAAREIDVDLIVISSHGRTGIGRILFGSTAEAVVRHATCPVLVVKPPHGEKPAAPAEGVNSGAATIG